MRHRHLLNDRAPSHWAHLPSRLPISLTNIHGVPSSRRLGLVDLKFDCSAVCLGWWEFGRSGLAAGQNGGILKSKSTTTRSMTRWDALNELWRNMFYNWAREIKRPRLSWCSFFDDYNLLLRASVLEIRILVRISEVKILEKGLENAHFAERLFMHHITPRVLTFMLRRFRHSM